MSINHPLSYSISARFCPVLIGKARTGWCRFPRHLVLRSELVWGEKALRKKTRPGPIHGSGRRHHCNGRKGDEKETVAPHTWLARENKATRGETVANALRQRLVGGPCLLGQQKNGIEIKWEHQSICRLFCEFISNVKLFASSPSFCKHWAAVMIRTCECFPVSFSAIIQRRLMSLSDAWCHPLSTLLGQAQCHEKVMNRSNHDSRPSKHSHEISALSWTAL